jgi:hypothetical protein
MSYNVAALAVSGSDLYVGGYFTTAGGIAANYMAKWDGSSWSTLGSGMNGPVNALAVSGNTVYAGGQFSTAGGIRAVEIAKWDGNSWTALGSGMNGPVWTLTISASDLYLGGDFTMAGAKVSGYVARAYLLPLPTLSVLRSGPDVTVWWPSADTAGFALEETRMAASPAAWAANTASLTDDGTNKSVTIPAANSPQLFRLRRP